MQNHEKPQGWTRPEVIDLDNADIEGSSGVNTDGGEQTS